MITINQIVMNEITERLRKERTVNIKIPSNESFANYPLLSGYNIYYYDDVTKELTYKKRKVNLFLKILAWIVKVVTCLIDIFVFKSFSLSTITSLAFDGIENGANFIKNDDGYDIKLIEALSKHHFKIRKKPDKKYKKLKKIVYVYFKNEPLKETYNLILLLCELIKYKLIVDSAVVIVSQTELNDPPQHSIKIEADQNDNQFIYDFSSELLDYIRNEQYENAAVAIRKILLERGINDLVEFEFVMQCLAFCYKYLGATDFTKQFSDIKIHEYLDTAKENKFITTCGADANFLDFCYACLIKYYRNSPAINSDEFNDVFKKIVENIRTALISNNEYFFAACLYAKFATIEASADNYIIAFLHNEFIKNVVNDECLNLIRFYASKTTRAKLFVELYEINSEEKPDADRVMAIVNKIDRYNNLNPVLQLCFYYYAVNPIYKSNCQTSDFIDKYFNAYSKIDNDESLKCIFGAQFLLFYTTIENIKIHNKYAKAVSAMLNYVLEESELLAGQKCYVKICRSLNGLRVDKFCANLEKMVAVKNGVKQFVKEKVYYYLNLGATYAFRSDVDLHDYENAINAYDEIKREIKSFPLCIQATYTNNRTVFEYMNKPSRETARKSYAKLENYEKKQFANENVTEERRHIAINRLIFAILSGQAEQAVTDLIKNTEKFVKDDNYFKFYFEQAILLYSAMYGKKLWNESATESVFFIHKRSFFEQKEKILKNSALKCRTNIVDLNKKIKNEQSAFANDKDYEYFMRADLFSLIERWYE